MEVTQSNFAKLLPEIEESIHNALFLGIDAEFTGLRTGPDVVSIDTPADYYSKIRSGFLDFLVLQFGLAIFNYDQVKDKYTYKTYSFYLFPKPSNLGRGVQDSWFHSQASSLHLLAASNFDFNKAFRQGITFLNHAQQELAMNSLEDRRRLRTLDAKPSFESPLPIPEELKNTVQHACDAVQNFIGNNTLQNITLPPSNAFVRKLIYQTVRHKFGYQELLLETDNMNIIVKKRLSKEERMIEEREKVKEEEAELKEAIGFTRVIEIISKSRKPLVGHNMMLDLCHIIQRFWKPLPEEYEDFKALVHHVFPTIYDTKHLCTSKLFNGKIFSTSLLEIYKTVQQPPFQMIPLKLVSKKGYNLTDWRPHDAGFDAFITGVVYQTLVNYIGSVQTPPVSHVFPNHPLLENVTNKVYLMRIASYMNLVGSEPLINRSHIFYMTFPRDWKTSDIIRVFNSYGSVYIRRLNGYSALITLQSKEQTGNVTEKLVDKRSGKNFYNSVYKVIPYDEFVRIKRQRNYNQLLFKSSKFEKQKTTFKNAVRGSIRKQRSYRSTMGLNEIIQDGINQKATTPLETTFHTDPVVRKRG